MSAPAKSKKKPVRWGKSVFRRALAEGKATIGTPAGFPGRGYYGPPMIGGEQPGRRYGPAPELEPSQDPVLPTGAARRASVYRAQTGRRADTAAIQSPLFVASMPPRQRAALMGLTPAQQRRYTHKANAAAVRAKAADALAAAIR
jgi:hypothetical protein